MSLRVEDVRAIEGVVAGWDPAPADAGVVRELLGLAAVVARVQVLALVAAQSVGVMKGSRDVAAWLRAQGLSGRSARVLGDAAWCVAKSSAVRSAVEAGVVSVEHVAELRPVLALVLDGACDAAELDGLLAAARTERVEAVRAQVAGIVLRVKQRQGRPVGEVFESDTDHGQKQLRAVLNPEDHAVVITAIDRIMDEQWRNAGRDTDRPPTLEQPAQRALALVEMARRSLRGAKGGKAASTAEVIVIVDAETFLTGELRQGSECRLVDGSPLPATVAQQLANDAGLRCYARLPDGTIGLSERIRIEPVPLDHARTERLATTEQRLALAVQHPTCAVHGCTVPYAHTQAHHLIAWEDGAFDEVGLAIAEEAEARALLTDFYF